MRGMLVSSHCLSIGRSISATVSSSVRPPSPVAAVRDAMNGRDATGVTGIVAATLRATAAAAADTASAGGWPAFAGSD
jgi:hypothetical protein